MTRKPCRWDTRQHGFSDTEASGYSGMTDKHIFGGHIQTSDDLRAFLNHAIRASASDVLIQAGRRIRGQIHGRLVYLTSYAIQIDQMNQLLRLIIDSDEIRAALAGQRDYGTAFTIPDETQTDEHGAPKKYRFRLNATAVFNVGAEGAQVVLRHIPSEPPALEGIGFPEQPMEEFTLKRGGIHHSRGSRLGKNRCLCRLHPVRADPRHADPRQYSDL